MVRRYDGAGMRYLTNAASNKKIQKKAEWEKAGENTHACTKKKRRNMQPQWAAYVHFALMIGIKQKKKTVTVLVQKGAFRAAELVHTHNKIKTTSH